MKSAAAFFWLTATGLVAGLALVNAQSAAKVPHIGFLAAPTQAFFASRQAGFNQGLKELGYVDGRNIRIEYRYADGQQDRLPRLANELVNLQVDVIVAPGPAGLVAKKTTKTIPIVFAAVQDPIATGLVDSLAKPGGNVTGFSNLGPELSGKRLEILKETFPRIVRVLSLATGTGAAKETLSVAQALHFATPISVGAG